MKNNLLHSLAATALLLTGAQSLSAATEAAAFDCNSITQLSIHYATYNGEETIPLEFDNGQGAFVYTAQLRTLDDDLRITFDLLANDEQQPFGTLQFTSTYNNESTTTYTLEPGKGDNTLNVTYRDRSSSLDKHYKLFTMKFWVEDSKLMAKLSTEIITILHGNDPEVDYLQAKLLGRWKWNQKPGSMGWWGAFPYEGTDPEAIIDNNDFYWWRYSSEAEFLANLWQSSNPYQQMGDECAKSYMEFTDDQKLTVYDPNGDVVRQSQFNLLKSNAPEWCIARLYTDVPGLMWPYAAENYGLDVKEFQILRLTDGQLFLYYSYNELGSGELGTFWNFMRDDNASSLEALPAQHTDAPAHNLFGQRIPAPNAHGLLIRNGKVTFSK